MAEATKKATKTKASASVSTGADEAGPPPEFNEENFPTFRDEPLPPRIGQQESRIPRAGDDDKKADDEG